MNTQSGLRRVRMQMYSMERMLRLMRAEVEEGLASLGDTADLEASPVKTALEALLAGKAEIPPQSVLPYAEFGRGVWVGYDQEDPSIACNVLCRSLPTTDPREMAPVLTRLTVNPVFSTGSKAQWCTLETEVDIADLSAATKLRLDLNCYFEISAANRTPLPRTMKMVMRMANRRGERTDVDLHHALVSSMSFEQSVRLDLKSRKIALPEGADRVVIILMLPEAGDYSFHLTHFTLKSLKA